MEGKIVIATPSVRGEVPMDFYQRVVAMILKTREKYPKLKFATMTSGYTYVHQARQQMVDSFLNDSTGDYMLWIDDDNIPQEDGLIRLLEHNKPIVSGIYFKRRPPYEPIIMMDRRSGIGSERRADIFREGEKGLIKVHSTGFGFILIKREVLEKMRELRFPHFSMKSGLGEDIWFCVQAQAAGYDVLMDTKIEVGHLGNREMVTSKTYFDYYDKHMVDLIERAKRIDGFMSENELEVLVNEAANVDFAIEVGSWKGRSATVLSASGKLTCVDLFSGALDGKIVKDDGVFMEFLKNMNDFDNVGYLTGKSSELFDNFPDSCADLIHIDGGHEYKEAKADIVNYWPKLKTGGKMLVHDYNKEFPGVIKAIEEFTNETTPYLAVRQVPNTSFYELLKL